MKNDDLDFNDELIKVINTISVFTEKYGIRETNKEPYHWSGTRNPEGNFTYHVSFYVMEPLEEAIRKAHAFYEQHPEWKDKK